MASFFLFGAALYGTMLPWSVRLLMLVGALSPFVGIAVNGRVRRDVGAAYPYPAQQSVFSSAHRSLGDDDPYRSSW